MGFSAVYILGGPCHNNDIEFQFSLRSLEKHMKHLDHVFVIGRKPSYLNETVIHIPHNDIYTNKARNIMEKIRRASLDDRVSNDFVFLNDDYFFTHEYNPYLYPYYYKCDLTHSMKINPGEYGNHIKATIHALQLRGCALRNYDTHKPIVYNKKKVLRVINSYIWNIPYGYTFKSLYCNTLGIIGEHKKDFKVVHPCLIEGWKKMAQQSDDMFSIGEKAVNISFKKFLHEFYPEKSSFER